MQRIKLRFENIQQVVGNEELSVLLLTDESRTRALSIICDETMTRQLLLRLQHPDKCKTLLPEALVQLLQGPYEMMIYGVYDGQYQVVLADGTFEHSVRLRISDAVLLMLISGYPLYIEEQLMERQCVPFDEKAPGVSIPINTMDTVRLNVALQNAIEAENYELASVLRDEIKKRTTK